jgi:hypothetical protein
MSAISFPSFYEKRLEPDPENRLRRVNTGGPLDGTGLRFVSVVHSGNRSESEEEAERISILVSPDTRAEIQSGALKLTMNRRKRLGCPFHRQSNCHRPNRNGAG